MVTNLFFFCGHESLKFVWISTKLMLKLMMHHYQILVVYACMHHRRSAKANSISDWFSEPQISNKQGPWYGDHLLLLLLTYRMKGSISSRVHFSRVKKSLSNLAAGSCGSSETGKCQITGGILFTSVKASPYCLRSNKIEVDGHYYSGHCYIN